MKLSEQNPLHLTPVEVADGSDGIKLVRVFRWRIPARYLFLAGTLTEFVELEAFTGGKIHHLLDAGVLLLYGFLMRVLGAKPRTLAVYGALALTAWGLNVANLPFRFVNVEGILWVLTHLLLAAYLARVLRRVTRVTEADIAGAVAFYLMVGIVFANVYSLLLWHHPGTLVSSASPHIQYDKVLYYSFMNYEGL